MVNNVTVIKVRANMHFINLIKGSKGKIGSKMLHDTNPFAEGLDFFINMLDKR